MYYKIVWLTELVSPVETIPGHFQREPCRYNESDNVTISRHKMILLLEFALMNYALVKFLDVNSPIG